MEISPDTSLSNNKSVAHDSDTSDIFQLLFGLACILLLSYFFFFKGYEKPDKLFWDENYHVASAQKYLDGTFFLENHPPLGKLIIALGEKLVHPNDNLDRSKFNRVDHLKSLPEGYSFRGMRLMPVLFLIGSGLLFFLIIYRLSENLFLSLSFSSLFMFDNATIVQSRAAHLEPIQFLFTFGAIYVALGIFKKNSTGLLSWISLGILIGLAAAVKLTSFILLLLLPFLLVRKKYLKEDAVFSIGETIRSLWKPAMSILLVICTMSAIFYIHFGIARNVIKKRYYLADTQLREDLKSNNTSASAFVHFLKESFRYIDRFNAGVPRLRPDSPKENGSHPVFWPFGKKSISYRWDKTPDGRVRHHRIHSNPVGWSISFLSIILCTSLILGHRVFDLAIESRNRLNYLLIEVFTSMWWAYMLVMIILGRVMYLYHYLVPLYFGFFASCLLYLYLFRQIETERRKILYTSILLFTAAQALTFWYFSPFTYHLPLTPNEFWNRQWTSLWRYELILW